MTKRINEHNLTQGEETLFEERTRERVHSKELRKKEKSLKRNHCCKKHENICKWYTEKKLNLFPQEYINYYYCSLRTALFFNYQAVNYVHAFVLSEHEFKLGRNKYMKTENYNEI